MEKNVEPREPEATRIHISISTIYHNGKRRRTDSFEGSRTLTEIILYEQNTRKEARETLGRMYSLKVDGTRQVRGNEMVMTKYDRVVYRDFRFGSAVLGIWPYLCCINGEGVK